MYLVRGNVPWNQGHFFAVQFVFVPALLMGHEVRRLVGLKGTIMFLDKDVFLSHDWSPSLDPEVLGARR